MSLACDLRLRYRQNRSQLSGGSPLPVVEVTITHIFSSNKLPPFVFLKELQDKSSTSHPCFPVASPAIR